MFRTSLAATFFASMLLLTTEARADHHEPAQVEDAVKAFYSQLSAGKFAEALAMVADGGSGYVATGGLVEIGDEEVRQGIVEILKEGERRGAEMDLRPNDIKVVMHGDTAIATYSVDATVKEADEEEAETHVNRGTLVFAKKSGQWKIVHWHLSQRASEDDEDEDDDDDDA